MVERGQVWWVDFGEPLGSEPGFRRPAVVVSSDRFNHSRIATVLVCAVTSNMRLAQAPGNVELESGTGGVTRNCVVNVSQLLVIDRSRLEELMGIVPASVQLSIDQGLRLVLDL